MPDSLKPPNIKLSTDSRQINIQYLLFGVLLFFSIIATPAFSEKYKKVPTIRENTYKLLSISQRAFSNNDSKKALSILDKLNKTATLNSYEKAMMWNQYASIYYGLNNIDKAISSYEKLLSQDNYPKALKVKTTYNIAQLYFFNKQYPQVITKLQRWFTLTNNPSAEAYALQAQAYYYLENHQQVVDSINKAIDIVDKKSLNPKEQWMVLLQSSLNKLGLEKHRLSILKWMVRIFPTKDYMLSLASAYATLDQQKEQLAVMELAYKKGHLNDERLLLALTTLFYAQGVPYKAAKVMQKGLQEKTIKTNSRNLKLLSNCLRAAQEFEKALSPLKQSAKLSNDAETYYQLATTYYQLARWDEAATAFTQALDRHLPSREQRAWVLLGQTYLQKHQFEDAINSFTRASTFNDTQEIANRWVRYAELERDRYEILKDSEELLKQDIQIK
ncbi:hypothetical protein A9Q81_02610 [Gammaproteobacteria bacterium 42_54_T18]|nr:hypothetical protein A9Q81_02610 [Gammaproteobacteria bacterium 42_54_T18]